MSELSILGFFAAVATIDTAGTGDLHTVGAVFFFIVLYLSVLNYTVIMRRMHQWDTSFMTQSSYWIKSILCGYVSLIAIYFFYGIVLDEPHFDEYVVMMEWNLVLIC